MAVVTVVAARDVGRVLAGCRSAVVAGEAGTEYLVVIDDRDRRPGDLRPAGGFRKGRGLSRDPAAGGHPGHRHRAGWFQGYLHVPRQTRLDPAHRGQPEPGPKDCGP